MILPISSEEFLKTRDDATLRNIITQGQPNYGMSPFGGALSTDQIDALVAYIRSWQTNPPTVSAPKAPAAVFQPKELSAKSLYDGMCAQCHGANFEGTASGPALDPAKLRAKYDSAKLFSILNDGVLTVAMPGVGHMFTADQVNKLIVLVAGPEPAAGTAAGPTTPAAAATVSFKNDVLPIFQAKCSMCHNATTTFGGWDSSTYTSATTSGTKKSAIVPGNADNSPMLQLLMNTNGVLMPPTGSLSDVEIQKIKDWINAGALDN
jgi:mono/diheme cytochrome c family protein